jgi:pimeloyl-ACP methyl ester carboxylesterase
MTDDGRVPGYFPYDVGPPPPGSGLVEETLPGPLGRVRVLRPAEGTPTTMFLHGVSLDSACWTPLVRATSTDGGRGDLPWLLVDVPGFGGSDPLPGAVSLDDMADALLAVLDAVGVEDVHLVGHSMGGFLGLHLAARDPDRVRSLATLNGAYVTILELVNHPMAAALRHPGTWTTYQAVRVVAGGGRVVHPCSGRWRPAAGRRRSGTPRPPASATTGDRCGAGSTSRCWRGTARATTWSRRTTPGGCVRSSPTPTRWCSADRRTCHRWSGPRSGRPSSRASGAEASGTDGLLGPTGLRLGKVHPQEFIPRTDDAGPTSGLASVTAETRRRSWPTPHRPRNR